MIVLDNEPKGRGRSFKQKRKSYQASSTLIEVEETTRHLRNAAEVQHEPFIQIKFQGLVLLCHNKLTLSTTIWIDLLRSVRVLMPRYSFTLVSGLS